ncbi:MAG: hypothetical protein U9O90_01230 [Euryarchaeota archaeon]|nr:hypothetical protein [Euryarchaeota archaeon]
MRINPKNLINWYSVSVQNLTPILEKVLGKKMALPSSKIKRFDELFEIFSGAKDIFIDGTERPIQRPKDEEKQKKLFLQEEGTYS